MSEKRFDPFGDFETRGYLRNAGGFKDPLRVSQLESYSFETGLEKAAQDLQNSPLSYQSVLDTHKTLFSYSYPTWAGKDRAEVSPDLAIKRDGMDAYFAHPRDIKNAIHYALDDASSKSPGEIYGRMAYAHPFLDGNGRTFLTIMDEVMRGRDQFIDWGAMDKKGFLSALTRELETPETGVLDAYFQPFIKDGAISVEDSAKRLRDLSLGKKPAEPTISELILQNVERIKNPVRRAAAEQIVRKMSQRTKELQAQRKGTETSNGKKAPDKDFER